MLILGSRKKGRTNPKSGQPTRSDTGEVLIQRERPRRKHQPTEPPGRRRPQDDRDNATRYTDRRAASGRARRPGAPTRVLSREVFARVRSYVSWGSGGQGFERSDFSSDQSNHVTPLDSVIVLRVRHVNDVAALPRQVSLTDVSASKAEGSPPKNSRIAFSANVFASSTEGFSVESPEGKLEQKF